MRISPVALAGLVALLAGPASARGQQDVLTPPESSGSADGETATRSEGAQFLLLPVGAKTVGMGGAVSAVRGNTESVIWAPAGIADLREGRLFFNHHEGVFETTSDVLSLLWPTGSIGTFAITYYLVDFGDLASTGPDGTVIGTLNVRNQEFLVTYANHVVGGLRAGISYKLIQLISRCEGACQDVQSETQTSHAVDIGLLYEDPVGLPIAIGGSVRHLGSALEGENESDVLPTRVRVGIAYEALSAFTSDTTFALALALDIEDRVRDLGDPDLLIGSELGVANLFFLRAGYAFLNAQPGGPTLGLGFTHDWFYLNMSRGFDELSSATGEESIQVSFGVIF